MEDSTASTIHFLRARLLAERSVSRTARQRAYELTKKVTELEKQLKFVSLQRKKAEKATVDVLAILENHGRNDLSESFDSSSDQGESPGDFKDGKHLETSEHGKVPESETEGFSGSEAESSSVNGRSLSWKSSKNSSSRFLEKKYIEASRRRRNSLTSTGSSPRRIGKSCRQIRHREHRPAADGSQNDVGDARREDEVQMSSEGVEHSVDVATEKDRTLSCNGHAIQSHGTERDMERALEHQAQFIAQYEAEEKAQREWEDKFRENNGSPADSCDPGTHSDVTEERDEIPAPAPVPAGVVDANFSEEPEVNTEPLQDHQKIEMNNKVSDNQNPPPELQGNYNPTHASPPTGKSYEPPFRIQENPDNLGSVLDALQQAKLSLKQNIGNFPLLETKPSIPTYGSVDRFSAPFIATGLFRLPTDYEYGEDTATQTNSLTYDTRLSMTNYPTDPSAAQFVSSPYRHSLSRSTASLDDRFQMVPTFPYQETRLEIPKLPPSSLDPRSDMRPSSLDPHLGLGQSTLDPRFEVGQSALDPRLGVGQSTPRLGVGQSTPRLGVGQSTLDPRLGVGESALDPRFGVGQSAFDPRLGVAQSVLDPRLGVRQSVLDPRLGVRQSVLDPRLVLAQSVGQSAFDPQLGVGQSACDPRLEMGRSFTGDGYTRSVGLPLRTHLLYDDYTRPNKYG